MLSLIAICTSRKKCFKHEGQHTKKKLGEKEEKEENFSIHMARVLFLSSLSRKKGPI